MLTWLLIFAVVARANPLDPCSTKTCDANKQCYFGVCLDEPENLPPSDPLGCPDGCDKDQQCTFGVCIGLPDRPNSSTTTCNPPCQSGFDCRWNVCVPSFDSNCSVPCIPVLQDCRNGVCVNLKQNHTCSPQCGPNSKCSFGVCVPTIKATCKSECDSGFSCKYGVCVPQPPPCWPPCQINEKCVNDSNASSCVAQSATCTNCTNTSVCMYGKCLECELCSQLEQQVVDGLANTDFDLSKLKAVIQLNESQWENVTLETLEVVSSLSEVTDAVINSDVIKCAKQATLSLFPKTILEVKNFDATDATETCAVLIARASSVTAKNLTVQLNNILQVVLDHKNVKLELAKHTIDQMKIAGKLMVSGDGLFQLPSAHELVEAAETALIHFSGDVRVRGFAGNVSIAVEAQQGLLGSMQVQTEDTFKVQGNILGASGSVFIEGTMETTGLAFEPQITLGAKGSFNIMGDSFAGANLALSAAGGKLRIESEGAVTFFQQILSCVQGSFIEYRVNASIPDFFADATPEKPMTGTIIRFDAITKALIKTFECSVKLVDDFGNSKTLDNVVSVDSVAPRSHRRLLLSASSKNEGIWADTELRYSVTNNAVDSTFPAWGTALIVTGSIFAVAIAVFFFYKKKKKGHEAVPLFDGSTTKYNQVKE